MLYKTLLLFLHRKLENERTISAMYYILKGKQSIQTIQDTRLFGLDPYYGILKRVEKRQFMKAIFQLEHEQYLHKEERDNFYTVTVKGQTWLYEQHSIVSEYYFNGLQFKKQEDIFTHRLQLLVQVCSNAIQQHSTYIPIVESKETADWVKQVYIKNKTNIAQLTNNLYQELYTLLHQISDSKLSDIWVSQLTGYAWIGKTAYQLALKHDLAEEDILLMSTSVTHKIIKSLKEDYSSYPMLQAMLPKEISSNMLTDTAKITYQLLSNQYTVEEIARARRLRVNTIHDHIVEIALYDFNFSIHPFVSEPLQTEINEVVRRLATYKLKKIKASLDENISYFQIRLVLAKIQQREKVEK